MNAMYSPKYHKEMVKGYVPSVSEMPSVVSIWASGICNFKCKYCIHSADKKIKEEECFPEKLMTWKVFLTLAEQLRDFKPKIDTAIFCGIGEPTLNTYLPAMIKYLKSNRLVNRVELVTNGILLEEQLSLRLIDAGVDLIMISIQGLDSYTYQKICGYTPDIEQFIRRIAFLFKNRNNCHIHIKTIDLGVPIHKKDVFIRMYGDYCDTIHIDYAAPLFKDIDYSKMIYEVKDQYSGQPLDLTEKRICLLPFQSLFILPNGNAVPCCLMPNPMCYGNIKEQSLINLCRSEYRIDFLRMHLEGRRYENSVCEHCVQPFISS